MPARQIIRHIDRLLERHPRVLVAIDGCAGAGKSTLGATLAAHYGCALLHMDDFFLQPCQRTPERFAQVGGNVDRERFAREVLEPLTRGIPFTYRPFDCKTMDFSTPITVTPGPVTVIEGSYSLHPAFGSPYHLTVYLTAEPDVQRRRILLRPAHLHRRFFEEWIPMENRYFRETDIARRADLTVCCPESAQSL